MKKYEAPEMEIFAFDIKDVITTSNEDDILTDEEGDITLPDMS